MKKIWKNNGITLVSLVITIIIMLILAGVSLQMVTGETSVLSKATTATYVQSAANLSEYFKTMTLGSYNEKDYKTKGVDYLEQNAFVKRRVNVIGNDVFYMYIVDKESLPDEIKSSITAGLNENDNMTDIYGVNEDYSVYYIDINGEVVCGKLEYTTIPAGEEIKAKDPVTQEVLQTIFNSEKVTAGNLKGVTELRINENNDLPNIKNLDMLYYFPDLKSLYIYKTDLDNMDGLKYSKGIEYLYMDTNTCKDYNGLSHLTKLNDIYFYNLYVSQRRIENNDMANIFKGLAPLKNLTSLRIHSYAQNTWLTDAEMFSKGIQDLSSKSRLTQLYCYNANLTGEIDVSGCHSLQKLVINNQLNPSTGSGVTKIKGLGDCSNITYLNLEYNKLKSLDGFDNIKRFTNCYLANNNTEELSMTDAQIAKVKSATSGYSIPVQFLAQSGETNIALGGSGSDDKILENLKGQTGVKVLNINNNPNMSFAKIKEVLPTLTGLEELTISKNSHITDLNWLLKADGTSVFPNLKKLNLSEMGNDKAISYFEPLGKISTLTSLDVGNNRGLTNLNFLKLSTAPKLTNLSITYAWGLTDLTGLENQTALTSMSIYGSAASDISPLKNLKNLISLNIGNCNSVAWDDAKNTDALNALTGIKSVMMGGNDNWTKLDLRKIQPMINNCTSGLDFMAYTSSTAVREKWVSEIKNLDTIEQIYLVYALYDQSERVINEINFSGCTNLKRITISGPFAIKSIITEGCTNLEYLYCNKLNGGSYITLPDVSTNTKLKTIIWTYNLMYDDDILKLSKQLEKNNNNNLELNFSNNAVTDISPFASILDKIKSLNLVGNNLYNTTSNQEVITALGSKLTK